MKGENDAVYRRKKDQSYYTNRHSCFLLQYHMVLVTKYRKPVLRGEVRDLVYQIIPCLGYSTMFFRLIFTFQKVFFTKCWLYKPIFLFSE
uniref:transposase n=1 Tax=Intestinibaculum porci TaxID=2487118 RepID=UPI0038CBFED7